MPDSKDDVEKEVELDLYEMFSTELAPSEKECVADGAIHFDAAEEILNPEL